MCSKHRGDGVIFCRYRRTRIGRALDARRCGFKVWPMRVNCSKGDGLPKKVQ